MASAPPSISHFSGAHFWVPPQGGDERGSNELLDTFSGPAAPGTPQGHLCGLSWLLCLLARLLFSLLTYLLACNQVCRRPSMFRYVEVPSDNSKCQIGPRSVLRPSKRPSPDPRLE